MNSAYIPKKDRYDTVLSVLREQIDEYFKVDADLRAVMRSEPAQSDGWRDLKADAVKTLSARQKKLSQGIHYNCQLIALGEGEPVKEDEENE